MNIPNALTLSRVALIPVLAISLNHGRWNLALCIFLVGMATDVLDGHIARTRGPITDFGKLMDPIADKLFVGTAFVILAAMDRIDVGIVAVILSREVAVSGLRFVAKTRGIVISADAFGKAKTALQVLTIVTLIWFPDPYLAGPLLLIALTTAVTIMSGMSYFISYAGALGRNRVEPASSPG
jgi:CDP-diacylglycerol--glycerol-3-phosphate 3-phosphatidyltransferase